MKKPTQLEQALISEGRDLLVAWATVTPEQEDERCRSVTAFLDRAGKTLPAGTVLPTFLGGAAFAAVMSLAREGKCTEATRLIQNLDKAAVLSANAEGMALLRDLRSDLATYLSGSPDVEGPHFHTVSNAIFAA